MWVGAARRPEGGLGGFVVGVADVMVWISSAVVGETRGRSKAGTELTELVNVQHDRELAALAAHVAYLPDRHPVAEALLDIQVVVKEVGCAKVLANRENVED